MSEKKFKIFKTDRLDFDKLPEYVKQTEDFEEVIEWEVLREAIKELEKRFEMLRKLDLAENQSISDFINKRYLNTTKKIFEVLKK